MQGCSLFSEFYNDFEQLFNEHGEITRKQFMAIIRAYKGERVYFPLMEIENLDTHKDIARKLRSGWKKNQIAKQLIDSGGFKRQTAYNRINEVINKRAMGI